MAKHTTRTRIETAALENGWTIVAESESGATYRAGTWAVSVQYTERGAIREAHEREAGKAGFVLGTGDADKLAKVTGWLIAHGVPTAAVPSVPVTGTHAVTPAVPVVTADTPMSVSNAFFPGDGGSANTPMAILQGVWEVHMLYISAHTDSDIASCTSAVYRASEALVMSLISLAFPDYDANHVRNTLLDDDVEFEPARVLRYLAEHAAR